MNDTSWFRTDELVDAVSTLEILCEFIKKIKDDQYFWKWSIIAVHNSLSSFMVCALTGSNGINLLPKSAAQDVMRYARGELLVYPNARIVGFLELYKRIKSHRMLMYSNSKMFTSTPDQDTSVECINELRNQFMHFAPRRWSIYINTIPPVFENCFAILKFLALDSNNIVIHDDILKKRLTNALLQLDDQLSILRRLF